MNNHANIFLSYHSSKVELVAHLSKYLEKNQISTWYAKKDIRSGEQWDEAINDAIKNCIAVVLLFCAEADSSIQIKRELSLADRYKKPVFWVRVERVEPNNLSYFLTSTQWFDWLDTRDTTLEKLIEDINNLNTQHYPKIYAAPDTAVYSEHQSGSFWPKKTFVFDSEREAAECVAMVYFNAARQFPDSTLVLPTGRSATTVFRSMIRLAKTADGLPFGEAHLITDTETFGVWSNHEASRTRHVNEMLIEPLKAINKAPSDDQIHFLSGIYTEGDPIKNAQQVLRLYPPSVHAVSLSPVGEILAYEVGTYNNQEEIIDAGPSIVEINEHSKKYIDPNQPSKSVITIGLGTTLSSNILLILAFDVQKANIINRLYNGPITAGIPATLLKHHPNAYIITTGRVAKEAKIGDNQSTALSPEEAANWVIAY